MVMIKNEDVQKVYSSFSELKFVLKEIETHYKVEEWRIDGIQIWPVIKLLGTKHFSELEVQNPLENKNVNNIFLKKIYKVIDILKFIWLYLRDWSHEDKANGHRDVLFLTYSGYRKAVIDGKYYLANIFSFMNNFPDKNCLILETTSNGTWKIPRYGKSILLHWWLYKEAIKRKIFFKKDNDIKHFNCDGFDEATKFAKLHHVKLPTKTWLKSYMNSMYRLEKYYDKIIKKCNPKLIIVECYYGIEGMTLIHVAKKNNIKVADLEHGSQGLNNMAYSDWKPIVNGYDLLPDYFFVYRQAEVDIIKQWSINDRHKAIIVGDAWKDAWQMNDKSKLPLAFANCIEQAANIVPNGVKVEILFSMDYCMLGNNIIQVINKSPKNYFWWIRMHPVAKNNYKNFDKELKKKIDHENVNWTEATELPLPCILARINLHITYASTIAITCNDIGIPSIVGSKFLEGYTLENCVFCNMDDISIEFIKKVLASKNDRERIWKKENNETGKNFIKNILK